MDALQDLVMAAQQGDPEAFRRIVGRFQDMAYSLAYAMMKDRYLAEDAAQEAFIEAYFTLSRLRDPAAFPGWFRRIIVKHSDRLIRRRLLSSMPLEAAAEVPSRDPDPADALEANELRALMHRTLDALPEQDRLVLSLFYLTGYTHQEMATWLEVPVSTVKKRLYDARRRLRKQMDAVAKEYLVGYRPSRSDQFAKRVAFFLAIRAGEVVRVQALLQHDASLVHVREDRHETILHRTPGLSVKVVEERLAQMRELSSGTGDGWTPLHWAVAGGQTELVALLVTHGADFHARDWTGKTPLHWAAWYGFRGVVEFLLARGATVNSGTGDATPLHMAVSTDQKEVVALLLVQGADPNARDAKGLTPLHWASISGHLDIVNLLLAHGVDMEAEDRAGRTPLVWATQNGHGEIVDRLRAQ
ncbi:MAG: sigma-70 family RNA polymerase sigma factor [Candidatus Latescibacteria bacterium]|nr:sigma-70 family RNA polymerase sigma factor [Candidatus Latescibacterota bacterium]